MDAACIRLFARCFAPRMATEPDRLAKATRAESVLRCRHRKPLTTRARRKGAAACVDNDPLVKRLRIAAFGGFTIFAGNDDRTAAFSARLRRCIAHLSASRRCSRPAIARLRVMAGRARGARGRELAPPPPRAFGGVCIDWLSQSARTFARGRSASRLHSRRMRCP